MARLSSPTRLILLSLLLLSLSLVPRVASLTRADLFPYGPASGDYSAANFFTFDPVPVPLVAFNSTARSLSIIGTMLTALDDFGKFSISPLYGDLERTIGGVYTRLVNAADLALLAQDVRRTFPSDPSALRFEADAEAGLVVSYIDVAQAPRRFEVASERNTFQMWGAWSSGPVPVAFFCLLYPEGGIQWEADEFTYLYSPFTYFNFSGYQYESWYGNRFDPATSKVTSVRLNQASVFDLPLGSNVNIPGKWCFKVPGYSQNMRLQPWLDLSAAGGFLLAPAWAHTALRAAADGNGMELSTDFHTCDGRPDQYQRFPGTDSTGYDVSVSSVTSPVECQRICTADCSCDGFVLAVPSDGTEGLVCSTKSAVRPDAERNSVANKALYVRDSTASVNADGLWLLEEAAEYGYAFRQARGGGQCIEARPTLSNYHFQLADCHYDLNQSFMVFRDRYPDSSLQWLNLDRGRCLDVMEAYPGDRLRDGDYDLGSLVGQFWKPLSPSAFHKLPLTTPASFTYPTFDASELITQYSTEILDGRLILTPNLKKVTGIALYQSPIELLRDNVNGGCQAASFKTKFSFKISSPSSTSADGLTFFVLTSNAVISVFGRATGGNLGYTHTNASSVGSSAVKFDTFQNIALGEPSGGHVAVRENFKRPIKFQPTSLLDDFSSVKFAWIEYDGALKLWRVFLNGADQKPAAPLLTHSAALCSVLRPITCLACAGLTTAYVGFSAATGGASGWHEILSWDFESSWQVLTP